MPQPKRPGIPPLGVSAGIDLGPTLRSPGWVTHARRYSPDGVPAGQRPYRGSRERENTVETREIVWSQVDEIRIVPESSRLRVEVRVELAAILTLASAK